MNNHNYLTDKLVLFLSIICAEFIDFKSPPDEKNIFLAIITVA
ncbi:hypothetical protein CSCA_3329 [Clostridium scatologenes]|uniref:Uncharacterized protein n=1 Tax=Clostridium scatologenes TaxID=1548 RepID=A0A0E3JPS2_CLOSL|nr:hypothetical protein CSCA_3329 [Clostridium scatologenes]